MNFDFTWKVLTATKWGLKKAREEKEGEMVYLKNEPLLPFVFKKCQNQDTQNQKHLQNLHNLIFLLSIITIYLPCLF